MKVVVLLAGVHDPKWPIAPEAAVSENAGHRIMSPFDEAALEMALRVRDADPATAIVVRIAGGEAATKMARATLALNIGDVATCVFDRVWDQMAVAQALVQLCAGADLVLLGREFGDCDDGLVPATLAGLLGLPFFGRVQTIAATGGVSVMRESGSVAERVAVTGPLVASVTNDRRTRLRKPLMKNVMQARQAEIGTAGSETSPSGGLSIEQVRLASPTRTGVSCAMLSGSTEQQARALADLLWEARA